MGTALVSQAVSKWRSLRARTRDAIALAIATFALWFFIEKTEICTEFFDFVGDNPHLEIDSLLMAGILSSVGIYAYAQRRSKESQVAQARTAEMAFQDELTGLPNRRDFLQKLEAACRDTDRYPFGCLMFDLDRFKQVNDTHGHFVGDRLLQALTHRLTTQLGPDILLARLSGDEFAVICPLEGRDLDLHIAKVIVARISEPFEIEGRSITIGTSIGVTRFPRDGNNATALLRKTDLALYKSKFDGRGRIRVFDEALDTAAQRRSKLENSLRKAVPLGEVTPYFQPLVNIHTEQVLGFEVLARWTDHEYGPVSPPEFIEIATELGLLMDLSTGLIERACVEAAQWNEPFGISVNIAPSQLMAPGFAENISTILDRTGLAPQRLDIEITENALLDNAEAANRIVKSLKSIGVTFSLDDFGAGYSSLHHLRMIPFDKIKIDSSFIRDVIDCSQSQLLVEAVVKLGHSLGKLVLAEGIETPGQAAVLRSVGCDLAQGWLYSKALPGEQLDRYFTPKVVPTHQAA